MAELIFSNNASSTTSGSILSTDTVVNVSSGTGILFPQPLAGQEFIATFIDQPTGTLREIVRVTNVTSDTFTIRRAQEGTSAQAWPAGSIFAHLHTAGAMDAFLQIADLGATSIVYTGVDTGIINLINVQSCIPVLDALIPNTLLNITISNTNTDISSMTVAPDNNIYPIQRADGNGLQINDIIVGQKALFVFTGTAFQLTNYKPILSGLFSYPLDYWAGIFTGSATQFIANIKATVGFPYPAGLIISGLTSQVNTGALEVCVNNGPFVNLIQMDGSPFVGPVTGPPAVVAEFHNLQTMIQMISDGANFRVTGYNWLGTGGGSGGGTPPVVPTPTFTYGVSYESVYVQTTSTRQTLPTVQYVPTFNIVGVTKESYGTIWNSIVTYVTPWWTTNVVANVDLLLSSFFQRGAASGPSFVYGDVGSLYAVVGGSGHGPGPFPTPSGFVGTVDFTGVTMPGYGPHWQLLCSMFIPTYDSGSPNGISANSGTVQFFQRLDNTSPIYGAAVGAFYVDMSRSSSGLQYADTYLNTGIDPITGNFNPSLAKRMGDLGGTWLKVATVTISNGGVLGIDPYNWVSADFYQRIT